MLITRWDPKAADQSHPTVTTDDGSSKIVHSVHELGSLTSAPAIGGTPHGNEPTSECSLTSVDLELRFVRILDRYFLLDEVTRNIEIGESESAEISRGRSCW